MTTVVWNLGQRGAHRMLGVVRALAIGLCGIGLAGCWSIPDVQQMQEMRAESAVERLGALKERQPLDDRGVYLSGALTLGEALEKGLRLNLTLQQETLEREIAAGKIQASMENVLPNLSASGGYTRLDDDLSSTDENGVRTQGRFVDQYDAGLRVTQPLFNGHIMAAVRAARLYREWAEASIRNVEDTVHYNVVEAYYNAVLSGHLLEVQVAALDTAERQLSEENARRRQGMASNYDVLRATVEVSNFKAQVLQAQNDKDRAYTLLFRLIGASPESEVTLTDALPLVNETIHFGSALQTALSRRADLAVAEYAVRMQREAVRNAAGNYFPEISLFAAQNWGNPDPHDSSSDDWGDEWSAGVQFSWSIFDGLGRKGTLRQERATLQQQELALQDAEENVVSVIRQLVLSLKTAAEFAESQSKNLETAKEALRLVEVGLREGQNTQVEVMDARQALTTASANYYQSIFDHAMVRLQLQKAMGLFADGALPDVPVLGGSDISMPIEDEDAQAETDVMQAAEKVESLPALADDESPAE